MIQNFVDKLKEQLLEGKSVNIEGLGVFMLSARSKRAEEAKDITAKSVESVRIFFQANKELRITKTATRADEKLDLVSLEDYLKKSNTFVTPENPDGGNTGGEGFNRNSWDFFNCHLYSYFCYGYEQERLGNSDIFS